MNGTMITTGRYLAVDILLYIAVSHGVRTAPLAAPALSVGLTSSPANDRARAQPVVREGMAIPRISPPGWQVRQKFVTR